MTTLSSDAKLDVVLNLIFVSFTANSNYLCYLKKIENLLWKKQDILL